MMRWFRKSGEDPLVVSMSGVKLGDRVLVLGAGDPALVAGVASKSGLTGHAVLVDEIAARTTQGVAAAERDGALVEGITAPWTMMPIDDRTVDVAIARDVLPALTPDRRVGCLSEILRVLRPGGRCLVIDAAPRAGLGALVSRRTADEFYVTHGGARSALEAQGFRAVRTLAERDGLVFVEGVRPNV